MCLDTNLWSLLNRLKTTCISLTLSITPILDFSSYRSIILNINNIRNEAEINEREEKFQVLSWSVDDAASWIEKNGFSYYKQEFLASQVDGDLLLQLDENSLKEDIGMINGIHRKRFMRLLNQLKCSTNYSSRDKTGLDDFLKNLGAEYCQYTYQMLLSGVHLGDLKFMSSKQLELECGISNSIHRAKILHKALCACYLSGSTHIENGLKSKNFDVFICYRRSNGSNLASLLYVYLTNRGFSVFFDVHVLRNGRFEHDTLDSVRKAKHFILVLSSKALDRCFRDEKCEDWVHKEIVEALNSKSNIIPVMDGFVWPEPSLLPQDMKLICRSNGVSWVHDYQEACLMKVEQFMGKEMQIVEKDRIAASMLEPTITPT